jgi:hypothetical protein
MDDRREPAYRLRQPSGQKWRSIRFHGGSYRIPLPPGPQPPDLSKAEREEEARAAARAAPEAKLVAEGLSVGVIVMGVVLAGVVVISVLVLISHH